MLGRRLPDTPRDRFPLPYDELREGDIWKVPDHPSTPGPTNLTGGIWMFKCPGGAGLGTLVDHTVREHDDGTVSVRPGDGSSNSILQDNGYPGDRRRTWHGYIEHNEWKAC